MSSFDGHHDDGIDRSSYFRGEDVYVEVHADTTAGQVAYGATCDFHGKLMDGDWHGEADAVQAVRHHLDVFHRRHVFNQRAVDGRFKHAAEAMKATKAVYLASALEVVTNLALTLNPAAAFIGVNASSTYDKGRTWPTYHAEGIYDREKQALVNDEGFTIDSDDLDEIDTYVWDLASFADLEEDDHVTYMLNLDTGCFEVNR